jgi:L-cysteine:1D-myo-inositol 2-amino-2-deoxy-alpha-D-glucopyranoside ligase
MEPLLLHDTRTGGRVRFVGARTVRVYVCGITPYDSTHLGHAFTYTAFDALIRYLEHRGHAVRYVRNVTDLDDDIFRKAREVGRPAGEIAEQEMDRFNRDLVALGCRPPDIEPWATREVPAMIQAVRALLAGGDAYALPDGRVYFDTQAAESFGELSRLDRSEMLRQFAEKGGDPDAAGKRDALDFLLWQPSAEDEPSWDTEWGAGRPGWHIECSVMAHEELGAVLDIHGGGNDLIFPHHEAEILQAEHLSEQGPFARIWMHVGMVALDGVKMSKSLGNLVFVSDLLERYEGAALRRYLLEHHYRQGWTYSDTALDDAAAGVKRWREAADGAGRDPDLEAAFHAAMRDDLDTPTAIEIMDAAAEAGAGGTIRTLADIVGFDLPG